ncbi:hypothetical protein Btru_068994 [Bulinus truncatus]|nr:hypothetical protein Btru_068994 [Bulinus truncatus]
MPSLHYDLSPGKPSQLRHCLRRRQSLITTFIAVQRSCYVALPFKFKDTFTLRRAQLAVALAFIFSCPPTFHSSVTRSGVSLRPTEKSDPADTLGVTPAPAVRHSGGQCQRHRTANNLMPSDHHHMPRHNGRPLKNIVQLSQVVVRLDENATGNVPVTLTPRRTQEPRAGGQD